MLEGMRGDQKDPEQPGPTRRAESVLAAIATVATDLGEADSWRDVIGSVFGVLGQAADVDRVYLYENGTADDGGRTMTEIAEWLAPEISSTMDDARNANYPYQPDYARYEEILRAGGVIHGTQDDCPGIEREDLIDDGILAVALVPVFAGTSWWGFMGFDDCATERRWSPIEIEALRAAAGTLGIAIAREQQEDQRQEAEAWLRSHVEHIPAVTYIEYTDPDNPLGYSESYISPQIEKLFGFTPDEYMRQPSPWDTAIHPEDAPQVEEEARRTSVTGEPYSMEYRLRKKNGTWTWVRDEAHLVSDGPRPYWHGVIVDITERKRVEEQLRESEETTRTLIAQIPAVVYQEPAGPSDASRYVSPQVEAILGCPVDRWLADPGWWERHVHPDDRPLVKDRFVVQDDGSYAPLEYRMLRDDGTAVWIRDEPILLVDAEGHPRINQGLMHDITQRKSAEEQIEFLAYHDKLTGLANRALFEEMLGSAMARANRRNLGVAVLFMDLDDFKQVNDSLGHHAGDDLLRGVAARLREVARQTDLVARQGGNEFLVLVSDLELADDRDPLEVPRIIAGRIDDVLREPFDIAGTRVQARASTGISLFPMDASDEDDLLRRADAAMYANKRSGHQLGSRADAPLRRSERRS